jgi:hypothetical protein
MSALRQLLERLRQLERAARSALDGVTTMEELRAWRARYITGQGQKPAGGRRPG